MLLVMNQSCSEDSDLKDERLSSFMLGGIYFINGYGGNSEVTSMMSDAGYTSKEELISGYKEIFEFPFEPSERVGAQRMLKQAWDISNKETLLSSVEDLKSRDTKFKAWDYARIANNLCVGYASGYLTKEEVYPILSETLKLAQAKYQNWDEYFVDFDLGRKDWNLDDPEKEAFETLVKTITEGENSIYTILPLND